MTRMLVTGAGGFVGRHILRASSEFDCKVIPVVRFGKEDSIEKLPNIERVVSSPNIFQENETWWKEQCKDIDIVLHVAWYTNPADYLQSSKNIDCLIGSLVLAKGLMESGVKRFVGVGSCFEYDLSERRLSIETPLKPSSVYASAKTALFNILSEWLPQSSIDFAWCRLFYLHGEGEDSRRLVPYIRNQLKRGLPAKLTTGTQTRDFLDAVEAGKKIVKAALNQEIGPINICSGIPITVNQLANQIADEYGRRDLLHFGTRPINHTDPPFVVGI